MSLGLPLRHPSIPRPWALHPAEERHAWGHNVHSGGILDSRVDRPSVPGTPLNAGAISYYGVAEYTCMSCIIGMHIRAIQLSHELVRYILGMRLPLPNSNRRWTKYSLLTVSFGHLTCHWAILRTLRARINPLSHHKSTSSFINSINHYHCRPIVRPEGSLHQSQHKLFRNCTPASFIMPTSGNPSF